jgi:hypothetical protein
LHINLHWFGFDFATIVISPSSVGLLMLNTRRYALACDILAFLFWGLDSFSNTFPSTINVQILI